MTTPQDIEQSRALQWAIDNGMAYRDSQHGVRFYYAGSKGYFLAGWMAARKAETTSVSNVDSGMTNQGNPGKMAAPVELPEPDVRVSTLLGNFGSFTAPSSMRKGGGLYTTDSVRRLLESMALSQQ